MNAYDFGINNVIKIMICIKFILSKYDMHCFSLCKIYKSRLQKMKMNTMLEIPF